jgi:hypothetical protein
MRAEHGEQEKVGLDLTTLDGVRLVDWDQRAEQ